MSFTIKLVGSQVDNLKRICLATNSKERYYAPLKCVRMEALGKANGVVSLQFSATDGKLLLAERIQVEGSGLTKGQSFYIPATQLKKSLGWKPQEATISFDPEWKAWGVTVGPKVKAGGHGEFATISHSFANLTDTGPDYKKYLDDYVFADLPSNRLGNTGFNPLYFRKLADVYGRMPVVLFPSEEEGGPVAFRASNHEDPVRGILMPVRLYGHG